MVAAIDLRTDFDGTTLRRQARHSRDVGQARRLLALAEIYDGGTRSDAARIGGVTLQSIRDWVLRFNSHGPAGLIAIKPPGPQSKLNDAQRFALKEIVETGPLPAVFPDYLAPIVRTAPDGMWELVMMRWGVPPPPIAGRHVSGCSRHLIWRARLGCTTISNLDAFAKVMSRLFILAVTNRNKFKSARIYQSRPKSRMLHTEAFDVELI